MKTAVITGANGDIGAALCKSFKDAGYYVISSDLMDDGITSDKFIEIDLQALCSNIKYKEESLKRLRGAVETGLTVLVNNAAVQLLNRTQNISQTEFQQTLDINLTAPFLLAQALLSGLRIAKGSIINIASIHATLTKPGFVSYATSKAALIGLTRSMAIDLAPEVRCNAIAPAAIRTKMLEAGLDGDYEAIKSLEKLHPVKRIGEPQEVARAALYLASEEASFITGTVLSIDGGIGARVKDIK